MRVVGLIVARSSDRRTFGGRKTGGAGSDTERGDRRGGLDGAAGLRLVLTGWGAAGGGSTFLCARGGFDLGA